LANTIGIGSEAILADAGVFLVLSVGLLADTGVGLVIPLSTVLTSRFARATALGNGARRALALPFDNLVVGVVANALLVLEVGIPRTLVVTRVGLLVVLEAVLGAVASLQGLAVSLDILAVARADRYAELALKLVALLATASLGVGVIVELGVVADAALLPGRVGGRFTTVGYTAATILVVDLVLAEAATAGFLVLELLAVLFANTLLLPAVPVGS
jgi:hypothetical protein